MCQLTIEVDGADVAKQQTSLHWVHFITNTCGSQTQILVHVVQSMSHGIHCINYKLNLALLLVMRITIDPFFS